MLLSVRVLKVFSVEATTATTTYLINKCPSSVFDMKTLKKFGQDTLLTLKIYKSLVVLPMLT